MVPAALLGPLLLALAGALAACILGGWLAHLQTRFAERRKRKDTSQLEAKQWLPERERERGGVLSSELVREVQRIHITTRHDVNDLMAGDYSSVFKGRGMEFEEVREYFPGDDVRAIDWNVTARMQRPFVKEFREERELLVMILVDISGSGDFGTTGRLKNELAAELAATLAFAATRNNDKVGLMLFTDQVESYIPPKKGRGHVWRLIREVLEHKRKGRGTDLAEALSFLNRVLRKKAVVFLVSDFLDNDDFESPLRIANRRHDLVVFSITDPRETEMPDVGFVAMEDAEDGRKAWIDTSSKKVRRRYAQAARTRQVELSTRLRSLDVDLVSLSTSDGAAASISRYFRNRERRVRR